MVTDYVTKSGANRGAEAMRGGWNDEQIDLLKRLWAAGETAAAIAERLGDISRSAVLGKIFRLRLGPAKAGKKPNPLAVRPRLSEAITRRRGAEQPDPVVNAKTDRKGKTLFELTNSCCRWPYRRPGTERYFFCGVGEADLEGGIPYCARHMKRAYLVPPPIVLKSWAASAKRSAARSRTASAA
jgi:GcrA cell cycle regulator